MLKSVKIKCGNPQCRHAATLAAEVWEEVLPEPITAATAGKLYLKLHCGKCKTKKLYLYDSQDRPVIDCENIKYCKGLECGSAPLSLIYIEHNPHLEYCHECLQALRKAEAGLQVKNKPTAPLGSQLCPQCGQKTLPIRYEQYGEWYLECRGKVAAGNIRGVRYCDWFSHYPPDDADVIGNTILTALKDWREIVYYYSPNMPRYVLSDSILFGIARCKPVSMEQLSAIRGIGDGEVVLPKFGLDIVRIVTKYCIKSSN